MQLFWTCNLFYLELFQHSTRTVGEAAATGNTCLPANTYCCVGALQQRCSCHDCSFLLHSVMTDLHWLFLQTLQALGYQRLVNHLNTLPYTREGRWYKSFCCGRLKSAPCLMLRKQTQEEGQVVIIPLWWYFHCCQRDERWWWRAVGRRDPVLSHCRPTWVVSGESISNAAANSPKEMLGTQRRAVASLCHKLRGPVRGTRSSGCVGPSHQLGWGKIDIPEVLQLRRQGIFSG